MTPESAGPFRGGEQLPTGPLTNGEAGAFSGGLDNSQLVVGEADGDGVSAGVVAGGAPGSWTHDARIAYTRSLDEADFSVYDKSMTTTKNIIGISVTDDEYNRYEQIRSEMLSQGRSVSDAEHWAGCAIGIGAQIHKAQTERNEYAALVESGRVVLTVVLLTGDGVTTLGAQS